jgi:hypothetical protein
MLYRHGKEKRRPQPASSYLRKRGCEKVKSAFGIWLIAFSLACKSVLKLLIQIKYDIKTEI